MVLHGSYRHIHQLRYFLCGKIVDIRKAEYAPACLRQFVRKVHYLLIQVFAANPFEQVFAAALKPFELLLFDIGETLSLKARGFAAQLVYGAVACRFHQVRIKVGIIREIQRGTFVPQRNEDLLSYVLRILAGMQQGSEAYYFGIVSFYYPFKRLCVDITH